MHIRKAAELLRKGHTYPEIERLTGVSGATLRRHLAKRKAQGLPDPAAMTKPAHVRLTLSVTPELAERILRLVNEETVSPGASLS